MVKAGDTHVTYIYNLPKKEEEKLVKEGSVIVHYVNQNGEGIKEDVVAPPSTVVEIETRTRDFTPSREIIKEDFIITSQTIIYSTGEQKHEAIVKGERDYYFTQVKEGDKEEGNLVAGETHVTYIYAPAEKVVENRTHTGNVIVPYVNRLGEEISESVEAVKDTPVSIETVTQLLKDNKTIISSHSEIQKTHAQYDVSSFKLEEIKNDRADYRFVEIKQGDKERAELNEGTTRVTYIYQQKASSEQNENKGASEDKIAPTPNVKVTELKKDQSATRQPIVNPVENKQREISEDKIAPAPKVEEDKIERVVETKPVNDKKEKTEKPKLIGNSPTVVTPVQEKEQKDTPVITNETRTVHSKADKPLDKDKETDQDLQAKPSKEEKE